MATFELHSLSGEVINPQDELAKLVVELAPAIELIDMMLCEDNWHDVTVKWGDHYGNRTMRRLVDIERDTWPTFVELASKLAKEAGK